jgi:hypothetical protein
MLLLPKRVAISCFEYFPLGRDPHELLGRSRCRQQLPANEIWR